MLLLCLYETLLSSLDAPSLQLTFKQNTDHNLLYIVDVVRYLEQKIFHQACTLRNNNVRSLKFCNTAMDLVRNHHLEKTVLCYLFRQSKLISLTTVCVAYVCVWIVLLMVCHQLVFSIPQTACLCTHIKSSSHHTVRYDNTTVMS